MRLPAITNDHLHNVFAILSSYEEWEYGKRAKLVERLAGLNHTELWLLSFVKCLLGSTKYKGINMDPFIMFPCSTEQEVGFDDFMALLPAIYDQRTVPRKHEGKLISFLTKCTEDVRGFYWLCLEQPHWLASLLRQNDVREFASVFDITTDDIHGDTTFISHGWMYVKFPMALTSVPEVKLPNGVIYRQAGEKHHFKVVTYAPTKVGSKKRFKTVHLGYKWLNDRKNIHTIEFVLLGKIDIERKKFYPYDYFNSAPEYARFRRGKPVKSYKDRLEDLSNFMRTNFLKSIERAPLVYCNTSHNVEARLSEVLRGAKYNNILAYDGRMNHQYVLPTVTREGVAEGIWVENNEVRGLIVWYQGKKVHVGYDFPGYDAAILYNPKVIWNKWVKFSYFEYADYSVGAIKEIYWDKAMYRTLPFTFDDGEVGLLERCPVCFKDSGHYYKGICKSTNANLNSLMASHGPDVWFMPSAKILKRRAEYGYDPSFVNRLGLGHRGYRFVANDKGQFMFQSDELFQQEFQLWIDHQNVFSVEIYTVDELKALYKRRYAIAKYKETEDESEETGSVCEVPELHEHDSVDRT